MEELRAADVEFMHPFLPLYHDKRLAERLAEVFRQEGLKHKELEAAVQAARTEQLSYKQEIRDMGHKLLQKVLDETNAAFHAKMEMVDPEHFLYFERAVLLQSLDTHWREHLSALDYLRQGIHLRSYAQRQPKEEYKREAFELFGQMLDAVKNDVTRTLMNVRIESPEQLDEAANAFEEKADGFINITYTSPTETGEVEQTVAGADGTPLDPSIFVGVSRNDLCPCGSGEKFKHCHGKLQ